MSSELFVGSHYKITIPVTVIVSTVPLNENKEVWQAGRINKDSTDLFQIEYARGAI